jgi:hypothetical protein
MIRTYDARDGFAKNGDEDSPGLFQSRNIENGALFYESTEQLRRTTMLLFSKEMPDSRTSSLPVVDEKNAITSSVFASRSALWNIQIERRNVNYGNHKNEEGCHDLHNEYLLQNVLDAAQTPLLLFHGIERTAMVPKKMLSRWRNTLFFFGRKKGSKILAFHSLVRSYKN